MKEGRGHNSHSAGKVEPKPTAINPAHVAQMGTMLGNHVTDKGEAVKGAYVEMNRGRGFSAPHDAGCTSHHCGSQGKHR